MYTLTYQNYHSYTEPIKDSWTLNFKPICPLPLIGTQHPFTLRVTDIKQGKKVKFFTQLKGPKGDRDRDIQAAKRGQLITRLIHYISV